jgi:hypothetical protein
MFARNKLTTNEPCENTMNAFEKYVYTIFYNFLCHIYKVKNVKLFL